MLRSQPPKKILQQNMLSATSSVFSFYSNYLPANLSAKVSVCIDCAWAKWGGICAPPGIGIMAAGWTKWGGTPGGTLNMGP